MTDLPLFIDPFLLFNSENLTYRRLHNDIIEYVRFLKRKAERGQLSTGQLEAWFMFREVKQNWFGYTLDSNAGHGLGKEFAKALGHNLTTVFRDFGQEKISRGSHLEKLCLIRSGVGRDNVSDFTTNLIKEFLLNYTQEFAKTAIDLDSRRTILVPKVRFNYDTETWAAAAFTLPWFRDDYVILSPKDILTKDETWISHRGLVADFSGVIDSVPNAQLREQLNNYFERILPRDPRAEEIRHAVDLTVQAFPEVLDYFILLQEDRGSEARNVANLRVAATESRFVTQVKDLIQTHLDPAGFYQIPGHSHTEAMQRVQFLKHVIEDQGGWRFFWVKGESIERERDLQLVFRLLWYGSLFDVNPEVNKGRGPVDFKVSYGSLDKTLVEFKLASNKQLKPNLLKQVAIYERANLHPVPPHPSIKAILYFDEKQEDRVRRILEELKLTDDPNVVLIDARSDNKPSASTA